jgi:hypothetical protein
MLFRIPKSCRVCWLAVLAVLVLAVAAQPRTGRAAGSSWLTGGAADSAGSATYLDPSGDGGTAPDITSVVVSSDAERRITFRVNLVRPPVPSEARIALAIDSDQDAATGYGGFDAVFVVDLGSDNLVGARWNGEGFASTPLSTATASSDPTGVTVSVDAAAVGTRSGFCFFVRALAGESVAAGRYDDAPDNGVWSYRLDGASSLTLTAADPIATKARAGKRFIALISVARSDGEQAEVTYGDIRCSATAAGRPLQATAIPTYGPAAGCSWRLPTHSTGSTLHATVTVTLDGATTSQTFTATIK